MEALPAVVPDFCSKSESFSNFSETDYKKTFEKSRPVFRNKNKESLFCATDTGKIVTEKNGLYNKI